MLVGKHIILLQVVGLFVCERERADTYSRISNIGAPMKPLFIIVSCTVAKHKIVGYVLLDRASLVVEYFCLRPRNLLVVILSLLF